MTNKSIILVVAVFMLLVTGMFGFTYLKKSELPTSIQLPPASEVPAQNSYGIVRIEATHFFINGVHTIAGQLVLPTPCDLLTTKALVAESMPEQIMFDFDVINNSETCTQVTTIQRFKVSANASSKASISARFMGKPVELNLVEAGLGETPDEFEIYIKG